MNTITFDSDPNSKLNRLRWAHYIARQAWIGANRNGNGKSQVAKVLNRARTELRHYLYGVPERHTPHIETTIQGIPCGIVVESYTPAKDWRQHRFPGTGPGDCDPPEAAECEWFVVDRHGYFAEWLEDKMDCHDRWRIEEELGV